MVARIGQVWLASVLVLNSCGAEATFNKRSLLNQGEIPGSYLRDPLYSVLGVGLLAR